MRKIMEKNQTKFIAKDFLIGAAAQSLTANQISDAIRNLEGNGVIFSAMGDDVFTFTD